MKPNTPAAGRCVVLVDLYWTRDKDPRIPLGHASLLTALRARGRAEVHSVVVAVNLDGGGPAAVVDLILGHVGTRPADEADVAIGVYVWAEDEVQAIIKQLRVRGFAGRIILGGPQISYTSAGVDEIYPAADVFVRGYGEAALCELAERPGRPVIAGVHYAGTPDAAERTEVALDQLASPWLTGTVDLGAQRFVRWETQRGCPYRCTFCQHREPGGRLVRRELAQGRIFDEVDLFCRSNVDEIAVLDPIFNLAPHATAVLERFVDRSFTGRLELQCRAEQLDTPFLEAAGALDVCLELGLQTIHTVEGAAIQRGNNMRKVEAALAAIQRRCIDHEVSLIFGLPEQTLASFEASVDWCLQRRVPTIKAFPLMLLRGTQLEVDRQRWRLVDGGGSMPMVIESSSFDRRDWLAMARLSEALKLTEGRHPRSVCELRALAEGLTPEVARWQPNATQVANV